MPGTSPVIDIARNVRAIEWLEAEMVHETGAFLHALVKNSEEAALDSLAAAVISAYLLARRLGYGFTRLDARVRAKLQSNLEQDHELEQWYGDISELLQYLHAR